MDHYEQAENLLKLAWESDLPEVRQELLTLASIHATLAVAQQAAPSVINHHHGLPERF